MCRGREMSAQYCSRCNEQFLTESDPYIVLPKFSGTEFICLECFITSVYNSTTDAAIEIIENTVSTVSVYSTSLEAKGACEFKRRVIRKLEENKKRIKNDSCR